MDNLPEKWNSNLIGVNLIKAFVTLDKLPNISGFRKLGNNWPRTIIESDQIDQTTRFKRPSAIEITHMEIIFDLLKKLQDQDSSLALIITLWALRSARKKSIKKLCEEKKWASYTFFRQRNKALALLTNFLNEKGVPIF